MHRGIRMRADWSDVIPSVLALDCSNTKNLSNLGKTSENIITYIQARLQLPFYTVGIKIVVSVGCQGQRFCVAL